MFVPGSEWHERDVARSAREEVFTLGKRGVSIVLYFRLVPRARVRDQGLNVRRAGRDVRRADRDLTLARLYRGKKCKGLRATR